MMLRVSPLWLSTLLAAFALVTSASPAHAQLVKRNTPAKAAAQPSLAEGMAQAVTEGLGKPCTSSDVTEGIPAALHAIFANAYESNPDTLKRVVGKYQGYTKSFEARWAEVEQKKAAVDAAVQKATTLSKAKKFADARSVIESVLTPISVRPDGKVEPRNDILLPMDAELPALIALAGIARDSKDPFILPDVVAALRARRRILNDKLSEQYVWFAYQALLARQRQEGNALGSFSAGMPSQIGRALSRIEDARVLFFEKDGILLAQGMFHSLPAFGVARGEVTAQKSVKKGAYGLFELSPDPGVTMTVGDKTLNYVANIDQKLRVNCRETDKIDGYNPATGKLTYREQCDYQDRRFNITLTAGLRAPPADWARADGATVWVIGKLKASKVKDDRKTLKASWTLTDAEVVDFRFLGSMTLIDFGNAAALMF